MALETILIAGIGPVRVESSQKAQILAALSPPKTEIPDYGPDLRAWAAGNEKALRDVISAIQSLEVKPPDITVSRPEVTVEAPVVNVEAPSAPEVTVEVPAERKAKVIEISDIKRDKSGIRVTGATVTVLEWDDGSA